MECIFGFYDLGSSPLRYLASENRLEEEIGDRCGFRVRTFVSYPRPKLANLPAEISSACVASVVRLYYSVRLAETEDVMYVFMQVALWGYGCFPSKSLDQR